MMATLLVTVETPDDGRSCHRFDGQRIRVGRLPNCDLSICHEAMPRELCVAWIEDHTRKVRIEERPNLTNPLLRGKAIVKGGVSGTRLDVAVGPISLHFAVDGAGAADDTKTTGVLGKQWRLFSASAIVIGLSAILFWRSEDPAGGQSSFSAWPDDPFCPLAEERCAPAAACSEMARLLLTRAADLDSRPGEDIGRQRHAAVLLRRAVRLLYRSGTSDLDDMEQAATRSENRIKSAYRREVTVLRELLRRGRHRGEVATAAGRVFAYLGECHGRQRAWLRALQTQSRAPLEGS